MPLTEKFSAAFSEALRAAATTQLGAAWESRVVAPTAEKAPSPSPAGGSVVALQFGGAFEGELYLHPEEGLSRETFPATEPPLAETLPTAWLGLLESSAEGIAQALTAEFGVVQMHCQLVPLRSDALPLAEMQLRNGEASIGSITLFTDAALRSSLDAGGGSRPVSGASAAGAAAADPEAPEAAPLHRVIDVPLAVTLRFGQRQLTLRELLELNTGSLVELDRQVEEPVDLMLGERIIARGEVVIVDGNYGMRVIEVIETPGNRLAALP